MLFSPCSLGTPSPEWPCVSSQTMWSATWCLGSSSLQLEVEDLCQLNKSIKLASRAFVSRDVKDACALFTCLLLIVVCLWGRGAQCVCYACVCSPHVASLVSALEASRDWAPLRFSFLRRVCALARANFPFAQEMGKNQRSKLKGGTVS